MSDQALNAQSWWFGLVAAVPLIGFWYKMRVDLRAEILIADKRAAEAKAEAESVRLELAKARLEDGQRYVTKTSMKEITDIMRTDAREKDERMEKAINGIHERLDELFTLGSVSCPHAPK